LAYAEGFILVAMRQTLVIRRHGQGCDDTYASRQSPGQRATHPLVASLRRAIPSDCSAPDFGHTVPRMGETDRQRRAREASHRYFTEARVLSPREVSALLDRLS
jgi:hypothetical protein